MKKILILGGTNFVGRNIVEKLLKNKTFEVCLFNRNQSNKDLFPGVRIIEGDRETPDIEKIAGENWDVIVDISSYYPDSLSRLLHLVEGKAKKYIYISTASVYDFDQFNGTAFNEDSPKVICSEEERTDTTMHTYGKRKMACEEHLAEHPGLHPVILRPGIIYGQYDHLDRLYYWIYRVMHNKEILLPENGSFILNLSYIKDIANSIDYFIDHETKSTAYNITTHAALPFRFLLKNIETILHQSPSYINASKEAIEKEKLAFPLYYGDLLQFDNSKITGDYRFHFTELQQSLKETIAYYEAQNFPLPKVGLSSEEEQKIIGQLK